MLNPVEAGGAFELNLDEVEGAFEPNPVVVAAELDPNPPKVVFFAVNPVDVDVDGLEANPVDDFKPNPVDDDVVVLKPVEAGLFDVLLEPVCLLNVNVVICC